MQNNNTQLVLIKDDYQLLRSYLDNWNGKAYFDKNNAAHLHAELKKAKVVSADKFPPDVVRLNSTVRIKAEDKNEVVELILVTPDKADIKQKRISVMAPIGTALIGFAQGEKVNWRVPSGYKTFTILEVINERW